MALKYLLFLLLIGLAFGDQAPSWRVMRYCKPMYCSISKGGPTIFPTFPYSVCGIQPDFTKISSEYPILVVMDNECVSAGLGSYAWTNQTDDTTITEWRCTDNQCQNCQVKSKTKTGNSATRTKSCVADSKDYTYIVNKQPKITDFYKKQADPTKNWYMRLEDAVTSDVNYFPYGTIYVEDINDKMSCLLARCDGKDKVVEYIGVYNEGTCDFSSSHEEQQERLPPNVECLQL